MLRDNPGTVPADNPFGAGNPVWAYGFRPFGLAVSPTGQVAVTGNGPQRPRADTAVYYSDATRIYRR